MKSIFSEGIYYNHRTVLAQMVISASILNATSFGWYLSYSGGSGGLQGISVNMVDMRDISR